jgi:voltage-gated potassium channel Kch
VDQLIHTGKAPSAPLWRLRLGFLAVIALAVLAPFVETIEPFELGIAPQEAVNVTLVELSAVYNAGGWDAVVDLLQVSPSDPGEWGCSRTAGATLASQFSASRPLLSFSIGAELLYEVVFGFELLLALWAVRFSVQDTPMNPKRKRAFLDANALKRCCSCVQARWWASSLCIRSFGGHGARFAATCCLPFSVSSLAAFAKLAEDIRRSDKVLRSLARRSSWRVAPLLQTQGPAITNPLYEAGVPPPAEPPSQVPLCPSVTLAQAQLLLAVHAHSQRARAIRTTHSWTRLRPCCVCCGDISVPDPESAFELLRPHVVFGHAHLWRPGADILALRSATRDRDRAKAVGKWESSDEPRERADTDASASETPLPQESPRSSASDRRGSLTSGFASVWSQFAPGAVATSRIVSVSTLRRRQGGGGGCLPFRDVFGDDAIDALNFTAPGGKATIPESVRGEVSWDLDPTRRRTVDPASLLRVVSQNGSKLQRPRASSAGDSSPASEDLQPVLPLSSIAETREASLSEQSSSSSHAESAEQAWCTCGFPRQFCVWLCGVVGGRGCSMGARTIQTAFQPGTSPVDVITMAGTEAAVCWNLISHHPSMRTALPILSAGPAIAASLRPESASRASFSGLPGVPQRASLGATAVLSKSNRSVQTPRGRRRASGVETATERAPQLPIEMALGRSFLLGKGGKDPLAVAFGNGHSSSGMQHVDIVPEFLDVLPSNWVWAGFWGLSQPHHLLDLVLLSPLVVWVVTGFSPAVIGSCVTGYNVWRIVRVTRVVKILRYYGGSQLFREAVTRKFDALTVSWILCACAAVILAGLIFSVEFGEGTDFDSLGSALWWSLITLTTIGYGDKAPREASGKVVATFAALMGVAIFTLPASALASGFSEYSEERTSGEREAVVKLFRVMRLRMLRRAFQAVRAFSDVKKQEYYRIHGTHEVVREHRRRIAIGRLFSQCADDEPEVFLALATGTKVESRLKLLAQSQRWYSTIDAPPDTAVQAIQRFVSSSSITNRRRSLSSDDSSEPPRIAPRPPPRPPLRGSLVPPLSGRTMASVFVGGGRDSISRPAAGSSRVPDHRESWMTQTSVVDGEWSEDDLLDEEDRLEDSEEVEPYREGGDDGLQ